MSGSKRRKNVEEKEEVYCLCHTEEWGPMVECCDCKMWCHYICVGLSEHKAVAKNWICPLCVRDTKIKSDIFKTLVEKGVLGQNNCQLEEENTEETVEFSRNLVALQGENKNLRRAKEEMLKNLEYLKIETENLKDMANDLQSQNEVLREENKSLKNLENLKIENEKLKRIGNDRQSQNQDLCRENESLKNLQDLKKLEDLEIENEKFKAVVANLQSQNEDLSQENQFLKNLEGFNKLEDLKVENEKLQTAINDLQLEVQEREQSISVLEEEKNIP
ncbi:PHD finger protein ING2 [Frankliniella fusca]|uniref:PHD finger protein ING2 n=1 Tax=Frankliniella fusca TaxID=407009 RepID=A0AAE1I222_9NEOP|nr:PHD finger protein ING2 [Frankliniella fusca]